MAFLFICLIAFPQKDSLTQKELKTYFKDSKEKSYFEGFWFLNQSGGIYKDNKPLDMFDGNPDMKRAFIKKGDYLLVYTYNDAKKVYGPFSYQNNGKDTIFIKENEFFYYSHIYNLKSKIKILDKSSFEVRFEKPNEFEPEETEKIRNYYTRKEIYKK